jgi:hypothetical protein
MASYDAAARCRHLQLACLLARSPHVPPRLDYPALQAEFDALDALEQAERAQFFSGRITKQLRPGRGRVEMTSA